MILWFVILSCTDKQEEVSCYFEEQNYSGSIASLYQVQKGERNGGFLIFNENGNAEYLGRYSRDTLNGRRHIFHDDGSYYKSENWVKGLKQDRSILYHRNGLIMGYGYYINDSLQYQGKYDSTGMFEGAQGRPIMSFLNKYSDSRVDELGRIKLKILLPKPPYVKTELLLTEYLLDEEISSKKYPFLEGENDIIFNTKSGISDTLEVNYIHSIPMKNGNTMITESKHTFEILR